MPFLFCLAMGRESQMRQQGLPGFLQPDETNGNATEYQDHYGGGAKIPGRSSVGYLGLVNRMVSGVGVFLDLGATRGSVL